ncbi:hypothetical protein BYT27DRAFT_7185355 [Phlegmacium glaucopus]|nr:hypothetical protein BYT27DRAFT_7185355 [Phlegmacium glaucopus]
MKNMMYWTSSTISIPGGWTYPAKNERKRPFRRVRIPVLVFGGKGFDSMVIWICGRRFVSHKDDAKGIGRLSEQDKDTLRKKKFVTAFGRNRNFDEGQMLFHVLPSQKT